MATAEKDSAGARFVCNTGEDGDSGVSSMGLASAQPPWRTRASFRARRETRRGPLGIACCVDAPGGAEGRARPARPRSERAPGLPEG